jgi:hypothetical protein
MTYRVLDAIVLDRNMPDDGLRKGDLGSWKCTSPMDSRWSLSLRPAEPPPC